MMEFIFIFLFLGLGFMIGQVDNQDTLQRKCVEKYAEMPHNKVGDHCKTILKFEKDTK